MDLDSFAGIQQYLVSYLIEGFQAQQTSSSPNREIRNRPKHKYGGDSGLRAAVEMCLKIIGWEVNLERHDVPSIFSVPRQQVIEESTMGILGEEFTDFRRRNEKLDLWGRLMESFFEGNEAGKNTSRPTIVGPLLKLLRDVHRSRRANFFTTVEDILELLCAELCQGTRSIFSRVSNADGCKEGGRWGAQARWFCICLRNYGWGSYA